MTFSITEEDYQMHREEFKILACQDDRTKLWEYFDKNWDDCCEIWVMAYRVDLPHFGNHINNRVESLFGKLKRQLKGHFTMRASLKVLWTTSDAKRKSIGIRSRCLAPYGTCPTQKK
ncbi:hypothetical protein L915_04075 [Phytophthora nicotianae]|uniref:Uncharacterized protein n=1 Tax=Phytophthora nicotianae TaxID=4792 RepID=W2HDG5_PHYNI|nr:hypothetical protein L915_04075 [Phytophthora nicotianae]